MCARLQRGSRLVASVLPSRPQLKPQVHSNLASCLSLQDQHCRLPGGRPELMGAMPAVWLLLPGTGEEPQAAGALMARVQLPPPWLQPDAQHALLQAGKGLDWTLRVLVYSRQGGAAMLRRDWLLQAEWRLYLHPRYRVPTWDSG